MVVFKYSSDLDETVGPSIKFSKPLLHDIINHVKIRTLRGNAPSTWVPGARAKAVWGAAYGKPTQFGTLTIVRVTPLLVKELTAEHVTTNQSFSDYMEQWVIGNRQCVCGRLVGY
jgi:uncharacterized protein YqfB (UPF0267 family)